MIALKEHYINEDNLNNNNNSLKCFECKLQFKDVNRYESKYLCRDCYIKELEKILTLQTLNSVKFPEIEKITDNIYLGNSDASSDKNLLKSLKITDILTVGTFLNAYFENDFNYKILEVDDRIDEDISKFFIEAFDFIDKALLKKGNVFIHCFAGKSRSPSVLIAYMMYKSKLSYAKIYSYVKSKRSSINLNNGFKKTLAKFEKFLRFNDYKLSYLKEDKTRAVKDLNNIVLEKF